MRHECSSCHQFFPHREDCPLVECQHGVTYDHRYVLERHDTAAGITAEEIRERWPRLDGKCPLGCGYEGYYYATMNHFSWGYGEWDGDIPAGAEVGDGDDDIV